MTFPIRYMLSTQTINSTQLLNTVILTRLLPTLIKVILQDIPKPDLVVLYQLDRLAGLGHWHDLVNNGLNILVGSQFEHGDATPISPLILHHLPVTTHASFLLPMWELARDAALLMIACGLIPFHSWSGKPTLSNLLSIFNVETKSEIGSLSTSAQERMKSILSK